MEQSRLKTKLMQSADADLAEDPTTNQAFHRPDDRFIPVRSFELAGALADQADRFGTTSEVIRDIAEWLEEIIDQEVSAFERKLTNLYAAFNPDRDTIPLADVDAARSSEGYRRLSDWLDYLLSKANFKSLSAEEIREAVRIANTFGLKVRLNEDRLEHLSVWVRGLGKQARVQRTWRAPLHGVKREVDIYRRMAVVSRLKGTPHVNLKLFKEIPITDIEALLPNASVEMNWLDRVKVVGGGAGVVGTTATKLVKLPLALAYAGQMAWVILAGSAILAYRAVMGYRNARIHRDSQRTKHLYYQNLDNNAGVVHMLVGMIAQEEVKEALLAYVFCLEAGHEHRSDGELDRAIEAFLEKSFGVPVDFDVTDAVETLDRLNLWADREAFRVQPPSEAVGILRDHWRQRRSIDYHTRCAERGAEEPQHAEDPA